MDDTGINFSNNIQNTPDFNIFTYRNFYNGGGVAIGDINNDGKPDIFFTANMGPNRLYLNKGNFQFEDISEKAGFTNKDDWSTGVTMVDINNDGWLDIYVCNAGYINHKIPENKLYINNHDLTFTDRTKEYGLENKGGYCTHAVFFDYDLDGDLDCYVLNNSFIPVNTLNYSNKRELRAEDWPVADFLKGGGDKLLRNDNGKFVDVSKEANIYGSLIGFGLGVTVGDVNGDNYPDIYVSNDFFERDYLYINQKDGTFKEDLENWIQHTSFASMGADMCDINNDGYPDIFTTDMLPADEYRLKTTSSFDNYDLFHLKVKQGFYNQFMQNTLQLNNRNGKFSEIAFYSGVEASDWSWGALMFDADNDGLTDIYVCNGIYQDVTDQDFTDFFANDIVQKMVLTGKKEEFNEIVKKMPSHPILNKVFKNNGNLKFTDIGERWGFTTPSFSNGAAYADLDGDGDLDLVINNVNQKALIYKNNSREQNQNNYISILLKGKGKNTFAIGSKIKIYQGSQIISREIMPSRGFQSSIDYKTVIGLGKGNVDSMIVVWSDRSFIKFDKPAINQLHVIQQKDAKNLYNEPASLPALSLFTKEKTNFDKHQEDDYVDFYIERNVPQMLSRQGPKAAVGDVNGDGLDDIYIAGAAGQEGQLYLQTSNGFVKKQQQAFKKELKYEDVAVLFFDCDGDGDLDMFIGSGGNNKRLNSPEMQNRLYKNDGKGNFSYDSKALPPSGTNCSVVVADDFDNDGDLDLFVGSRSTPQNYGIDPRSFLLQNDGKGNFTDVTASKAPDLVKAGMITAAAWVDVDDNGKKELIIAGEWMPPKIFSYKNGQFAELKTGLENYFGWWQTLAVADIDGDGDQDLILGNIGENYYLRPDENDPVKVWVNDFGMNGGREKIFTRTINGRDIPVFMRRDITEQVPALKKQNLKNHDYAQKSIQELFPADLIRGTLVKKVNYGSSCIAINDGKGHFSLRKLPAEVQFSSLNAIKFIDVNHDGYGDIVCGGNFFELLPQFCRLDASYGNVLINDGKGNFSVLPSAQSGIEVRNETRDIVSFVSRHSQYLLFLENNDYPVLYKLNEATDKNMK